VNDDERQVIQMMKELVTNLGGDRMRLRDRQLRLNCDVQLDVQSMSEPASPHFAAFVI
jgi:hypothetical protein